LADCDLTILLGAPSAPGLTNATSNNACASSAHHDIDPEWFGMGEACLRNRSLDALLVIRWRTDDR